MATGDHGADVHPVPPAVASVIARASMSSHESSDSGVRFMGRIRGQMG